jgi:SAM-dependent methyltransferase
VSAGAIEKAQQFAGEARLPFHYRAVDLNAGLPVASAPFDMIYAMAAIHHIEALERLFDAVAKSLVPTTGRFWFLEYCGPSRLQWRQHVIDICNRVLEILPPELRGEVDRVERPGPRCSQAMT